MSRSRKSSKRSAAARKAARTRKAKAAARRRAALKGARTRARRRNPSKPRRSTRKGMVRKTARRAYMPKPRRRRRRANPAKFNLNKLFKDTMGLVAPAAAVLFTKNYINNWPAKKDDAGNTIATVGQRVGPIFPIVFDLAALWAVPRFLLKGGQARYRRDFTTIMSVFLTLDTLNLISYLARRGWSMSDDKLLTQGQPDYPEWTDMLSNVEPEARVRLDGYPFHRGHQHPHSHPHAYLQGAPQARQLPAGEIGSVYDTNSGRFVAVVNS